MGLENGNGDFIAVVSWGDGTTDIASVSGGNGSFTVTDDHTYAEKGSYPITVQISDTVTGGSASAATTATVTDAPLTLTGGFQLGDPMTNAQSSFIVATFTDANPDCAAERLHGEDRLGRWQQSVRWASRERGGWRVLD